MKLLIGLAVLIFQMSFGFSVFAGDSRSVLEEARALESSSLSLLAEQYRFEEGLLTPERDRVLVFLSVPHGARVILDQVTLTIDGKAVANYLYAATELLSFKNSSAQLLYAGRLAPGPHVLRLDTKTMQGRILPMKDYPFTKEDGTKFVELQISGYQVREVVASDW